MSQTVSPADKYSRRGLGYNVATSLAVMAIGGWLSFLFAPEEITCVRPASQEVSCELRRLVLGVPAWERRLDGLRVAEVKAADQPGRRFSTRSNGISQHWIRLAGNDTGLDTGSAEDVVELHAVTQALNAMVKDPGQTQVQLRIGGTPTFYPWAAGGFLLGAAILPIWLLGFLLHRLRKAVGS